MKREDLWLRLFERIYLPGTSIQESLARTDKALQHMTETLKIDFEAGLTPRKDEARNPRG